MVGEVHRRALTEEEKAKQRLFMLEGLTHVRERFEEARSALESLEGALLELEYKASGNHFRGVCFRHHVEDCGDEECVDQVGLIHDDDGGELLPDAVGPNEDDCYHIPFPAFARVAARAAANQSFDDADYED